MTVSEMAQAQPLRLKVIEVKAGDTVERLAKRMAVADRQIERFRVLTASATRTGSGPAIW